jgi:hypothetical protein
MPKKREELHELTVAALRDLAKKRLGRGVSKLRTKAQLIAALESGVIQAAPAPRRGKKPPGKARKVAGEVQKKPIHSPAPKAAPKIAPKIAAKTARRSRKAAIQSAAAPDLDGRAPEPLLVLPLDARTLLVRWSAVPVRGKDERWELEVFSDGQAARTVQVAPQSRQARLRELVPGPVYRARLIARASNGSTRVIGSLSQPVVFYGGPEPVPAPERFVHYSWAEPAASAQAAHQPAPGVPLPSASELAALGAAAAWRFGSLPTSPSGWLPSSNPTSFAK